MEEFIPFASKHYLLFIALAVVIALIIMTELRRFTQGYDCLLYTSDAADE